jgi:hypothetical protein
MIAWILDRAKERSTWMGLFSLAGAVAAGCEPSVRIGNHVFYNSVR